MKFLTGCLLTAFICCLNLISFAQMGTASVKGIVLAGNHVSPAGTTVTLLMAADSSIVKSTICTQEGNFNFDNVARGIYLFLVNKAGYKEFYSNSYTVTNRLVDVGVIELKPSKQLNEVTITDRRNFIQVMPDKTVLNVDKSILAAGNSVLDVLSTAPGVRIIDNQVLLKGGQKALIAINGKPIGAISDEQLTDLLKSYPSNAISQVELIENPSAKYDAAGGGGVINIILKKSMDTGFKANITESAAYGQKYKLNTGINLNYRTQKWALFGTYNFADNKTPRLLDIDRNVEAQKYDLNYNSTTQLKSHNFNAGLDYSIAKNQTVGALFYGYHNQLEINKDNTTDIYDSGILDSNIVTNSHIDRAITNLNYNLNYKGSFGKKNSTQLSADLDYSTYDRSSYELLENDFFFPDGSQRQPSLYDINNSPSHITVRSEKLDFSQRLSKNSVISIGVKNSQVNSNNKIDFLQSADRSAGFVTIPELTDKFEYYERINAAYVTYAGVFKNTTLIIGLRGEQTNSTAASHHPEYTYPNNYYDLFPNFLLTQALGKNNRLTLDYNRRITRPNYQDLNPFVAYIDQYTYNTGNPLLKPEDISSYSVSDIYKGKYKLTINATVTSDYAAQVAKDSAKIYTTTIGNLGDEYVYEAELNIPIDVTKWWRADLYLDGAYIRYVYGTGAANITAYDKEIKLNNHFTIARGLQADLYWSYDSPTYQGIKQYRSQWTSRAGISQAIMHNQGSIRLAVSDIFNTDEFRYTSHYLNLDLTGREKPGTRFVTATFTYRFGRQNVKGARTRIGGNAEEQNRLNGSENEK